MKKSVCKKVFILDTNVVLHDPQAIFKFKDNIVVIPMTVIEELDNFKKDQDENGRNSRQFSRYIDELREKGELSKGVSLTNGGTLKVNTRTDLSNSILKDALNKADNIILASVCDENKNNKNCDVIFITKDINLRIKSDILGMRSEDYRNIDVQSNDMYSGMLVVEVLGDVVDRFFKVGELYLDEVGVEKLYPNQYILVKDMANRSHRAIGRYNGKLKKIVPLIKPDHSIFGINAKNLEQSIAFDLLLNDDIKLVSLVGMAGTGKTLLCVAAGLLKTLEDQIYTKMLVSRPIYPLGKDLGFLPGSIEEKLNPWMKPILDNLEFLMSEHHASSGKASIKDLLEQEIISVEPLTYIRGRSIPNQIMIIDEAQNLTPHEIKTIITRAGEGTKIILTGDVCQIDNPWVDSTSNGLTHVIERFKNDPIAGHITLIKGERSTLATLASELL